MAKIHELSPTLANQIAAGEVIERPASVVKELVENAIDAGATQVDVLVEDAGLRLVQVIDNGAGIEPDDVPTAFVRHATSKILTTRDLFNVHSLGFRGEALASIAAVADVTLVTATENGLGTSAHIVGGAMQDQHTTAARQGTSLSVRDLFYNTPARLKYVKSQATELSRIVDIVNRLALAHPEVAFTLKNGQNTMLKTAGHGDLQQTIAGIYGVATAKSMLQITGQDLDFTVQGFTSLPDTTRASRNYLSLMVNGRYIKNYQLVKALIAGYGSKLMVGRYPIAVIDITMDPLLVDVNVHPTKQEVRLSKEEQLSELLTTAIRSRLGQENLIPDALHNLRRREPVNMDQLTIALNAASQANVVSDHQVPLPVTEAPAPEPDASVTPTDAGATRTTARPTAAPAQGASITPLARPVGPQDDFGLTIDALDPAPIFNDAERLADWDTRHAEPVSAPTPLRPVAAPAQRFPQLRYLAQLHGTYLLAEADDGLYLLDQHAAQERVNYEFYRQAIGQVAADQQALLVPLVLDYPASDAVAIRAHRDVLASVGLFLEDWGQNTFEVRQHPTWFKAGQEEDTIREMVDWVLRDGRISVAKFREKTAIMMSCKRAIKANHHLDEAQAKALLVKLADCENPFNCPHGRPVLVQFTNTDLEKMFKRIQDSHESGDDL
ncbi:DNA mismatch repair endonuclease MutL [Lacticaseibacillus absianus]|uniref:DNA mismatch repair endonuclease MutL n=1 Tax=Lacticaseibacillus absianus TaxID=2729623 RepID=UPI0015CE2A50|nr:DNA mismatch repair endonuclease MutL [Lacticaseibacillus absianus]